MAGFFDRLKSFVGFDEDYYDDEFDDFEYDDEYDYDYDEYNSQYDDYYEEKEPEELDIIQPSSNISSFESFQKSNSVSKGERVHIKIHEPLEYEDAPKVIDDILAHRIAVLNIEMLERDKKNKVFDFVNGGIYALNAKIQKVSTDIFVIAPKGFEIDGKIKDQINSKGFYNL